MTIFNSLHPYTIGYDDVFKHFDALLNHQQPNYPPYNIIKTGDYTHCVEVALAGYSKAEVEVIVEDKTLTIKSADLMTPHKPNDDEVVHKGIARRAFKRVFTLAEDVIVNDAVLKDGLLKVELERVVPEEKKPRSIEIK
jgi:molecular chaperone IbpA